MKRGELYRVRRHGRGDPKAQRVFAIVSRQTLVDSKFSSVICAPIYSRREGLSTEVSVGPREGLEHESSILCDALVSLPKSALTDYVGTLDTETLAKLEKALRIALATE